MTNVSTQILSCVAENSQRQKLSSIVQVGQTASLHIPRLQCNPNYLDPFGHDIHVGKLDKLKSLLNLFCDKMASLCYKYLQQHLYSYTTPLVQISAILIRQLSCNYCHAPKYHWPNSIHMCTSALCDLQGLLIIEVPDNQSPDSQGSTVSTIQSNYQQKFSASE